MIILNDLQAFGVAGAILSFWVFKKSTPPEQPPKFKGRWVETTDDLDEVLKNVVSDERDRIEEVQDYSLLAQNNEGSALTITTLETHAGLVVAGAAAEVAQKKAVKLKEIQNSIFYVIKMVSGDTVLHAVTRAGTSWRTKKALSRISAFYVDDQLGLDNNPSFEISKYIDFFIIGDGILIGNKGHFESILSYKQAHKEDFSALQEEPEFIEIFAEIAPLRQYVGENKIQLRRASAIRQKAHYKNKNFMTRLRARHTEFGLNLQFDANGKIVATQETSRDIISALLDHRLASGFSRNIYEVPHATTVVV